MNLSMSSFSRASTTLHSHAVKFLPTSSSRSQFAVPQNSRARSSHTTPYEDEARSSDFNAARQWYSQFRRSIIPVTIAQTSFSKSSGPGGQKTNKTSSKATTVWPLSSLKQHVPKVLHSGLRSSTYYVASSDSISIQCDTHRSQTKNKEETHDRLLEEVERIYKKTVPGTTSPEQKKKVEDLLSKPRGGFQKFFFDNRMDKREVQNFLRHVNKDKVKKRKIKALDAQDARQHEKSKRKGNRGPQK